MSHAAACLQWEATNRSWLQVKKLNPPPPVQLSLVWPLLYKFRDCTRLAQPPLPVPSQRTEPTPSIFPWPQSLLQNPQRYTVRDTQFKVEKAFRGHMAVPLPFYRLLPEDPLLEDGHGGTQQNSREQVFPRPPSHLLHCSALLQGRSSVWSTERNPAPAVSARSLFAQ